MQDLAHLHVQDFAHMHIKSVQIPSHFVFYPPRCMVQSARYCTYGRASLGILAHQKFASTKTLSFFLLPTCKVKSARSCIFAHARF